MKFDYCSHCTKLPVPLTRETFEQAIASPRTWTLCNQIAAGRTELKRELPAACWQAAFNGRRRSNQNACPSGLFALDIDHIDDPKATFESLKGRIPELGIYIVHMTPSTHGLRIVARCRNGLDSIAANQAWLAREIGVEHDACTHDMARLSFLAPKSYFYHYDPRVFSDTPSVVPGNPCQERAGTAREASPGPTHVETEARTEDGAVPSFRNVPYSVIVDRLVEETGGQPYEGERNNRLYLICRNLANITDRNPDLIYRICPRFGLDAREVRSCCESACKAARTGRRPYAMYRVLDSLGIAPETRLHDGHTATDEDKGGTGIAMPDESHLPPLVREFVQTAPEDFKPASAMACLPICGALGSRLRARYVDGEMQAPSFIVNVTAPAASGKSLLLRISDICLAKIREKDEEGRGREMEHKRQMMQQKRQKAKLEEPRPIIQEVPTKVSVAQLMKRMSQARGLHLVSITPEADTLTNSNNLGLWAEKSDIYRVSQDGDGGRYGQDYMSDASFSGMCKMRYNMLTLGTPGAMARAFPDVENGLVTRCIMVELPSQFGKHMPTCTPMEEAQRQTIETKVDCLMAISRDQYGNVLPEHVLDLPWLNEAVKQWIEAQRLTAIRDNDYARDQFMRRAALIGFRAGMVAAFLWGDPMGWQQRGYTTEFALWVADTVLDGLLQRYSSKVNREASLLEMPKARNYPSLFGSMGDTFSADDLKKAAQAQGIRSPAKRIIFQGNDNGLIEKHDHTSVKLTD